MHSGMRGSLPVEVESSLPCVWQPQFDAYDAFLAAFNAAKPSFSGVRILLIQRSTLNYLMQMRTALQRTGMRYVSKVCSLADNIFTILHLQVLYTKISILREVPLPAVTGSSFQRVHVAAGIRAKQQHQVREK